MYERISAIKLKEIVMKNPDGTGGAPLKNNADFLSDPRIKGNFAFELEAFKDHWDNLNTDTQALLLYKYYSQCTGIARKLKITKKDYKSSMARAVEDGGALHRELIKEYGSRYTGIEKGISGVVTSKRNYGRLQELSSYMLRSRLTCSQQEYCDVPISVLIFITALAQKSNDLSKRIVGYALAYWADNKDFVETNNVLTYLNTCIAGTTKQATVNSTIRTLTKKHEEIYSTFKCKINKVKTFKIKEYSNSITALTPPTSSLNMQRWSDMKVDLFNDLPTVGTRTVVRVMEGVANYFKGTSKMYDFICRVLFEVDKNLYQLVMSLGIDFMDTWSYQYKGNVSWMSRGQQRVMNTSVLMCKVSYQSFCEYIINLINSMCIGKNMKKSIAIDLYYVDKLVGVIASAEVTRSTKLETSIVYRMTKA